MIRWMAMASALFLTACVSHDEVARVTSPDGGVDAVLVETNGGATTSFGYEIHVVPRGNSPRSSSEAAFLYGAIRNEQAYGVNLRWTSPTSLAIEYLSAHSATLPSASVAPREIAVQLVDGVSDPTAPPGGMLYNRQGRPHDPR
jgi:hypothetical protein